MSLVPRVWNDAQAGLSYSLVQDNDYMLDVHLWDGLDMQPGQAHVCMKASS